MRCSVFPSADQYLLTPFNLFSLLFYNQQNGGGKKRRKEKEEKGEKGQIKLQIMCSTLILSTVQIVKI